MPSTGPSRKEPKNRALPLLKRISQMKAPTAGDSTHCALDGRDCPRGMRLAMAKSERRMPPIQSFALSRERNGPRSTPSADWAKQNLTDVPSSRISVNQHGIRTSAFSTFVQHRCIPQTCGSLDAGPGRENAVPKRALSHGTASGGIFAGTRLLDDCISHIEADGIALGTTPMSGDRRPRPWGGRRVGDLGVWLGRSPHSGARRLT